MTPKNAMKNIIPINTVYVGSSLSFETANCFNALRLRSRDARQWWGRFRSCFSLRKRHMPDIWEGRGIL